MGYCNSFALIQCWVFFLYNGTCGFLFSITNQCVTDCSDSWNHFLSIVSHSLTAPHPHCLLFPCECCDLDHGQGGLCVPCHGGTVTMALCCSASLWHCGMPSWVLGGQLAHGIFRSSLCTRQCLKGTSTVWKRPVCCWAGQLLLPLCVLVASRSRSPPGSCQGQGCCCKHQGGVLVGEDTPLVWSLCSVFKAWSDLGCHKFGTQMTEESLNTYGVEEK